jgi:rubredoxin
MALWECRVCGRLYIDDLRHELQSYLPEGENTAKEILRSREAN